MSSESTTTRQLQRTMAAEVCSISVRDTAAFRDFDDEVSLPGGGSGSPRYAPRIEVDAVQKSHCPTERRLPTRPLVDGEALRAMERLDLGGSPLAVSVGGDASDREVGVLVQEETMLSVVQPREECKSPIDRIRDFVEDGVDAVADVVGEVGHFMEYAAKTLAKRESLLEEPENNVHFIHPITQQIVGLGLHITQHTHGCSAFRVIEGGLASKFKLQHGDVIRKINGRNLRNLQVEHIVNIFAELDITRQITLRVVRLHENDDGSFSLYELDITITITISEDNVSFEIEAVVTATYLRYQSTTKIKYIAQTPVNESTVYVRVNGKHAKVSPSLDKKCRFRMELYQGGSKGRRVCVIRNDSSAQVIDKTASWSTELGANDAPSPKPSKTISNPDEKFFYWLKHPRYSDEEVFQSVTNENLFMAVGDNDSLYLETFPSVADVDSTGRFRVINGK